jgi:HPr kinase/phosphorylase
MNVHASCAAREGSGVLLLGPPGAGKSDLLLRLLSRGFQLVADDQVEVDGDQARPPAALAGLLEVRGLGIVRLPHVAPVRLALAVHLLGPDEAPPPRLPEPRQGVLRVPEVTIDAAAASAPERIALALDCALGRVAQLSGAFAA